MVEREATGVAQFSLKDQAASFVKLYLRGITSPTTKKSKV
jgi:hypothetical protein